MGSLTFISKHSLAGTPQPETVRAPEIEKGVGCDFDSYLLVPDSSLDDRIAAAKAKLGKDAVILGHHYQCDEVVKFADLRGDSLKLSQQAAEAGRPGSGWAVGTEIHLVNRLGKQLKDRKVIPLDPSVCVCTTMFRITPRHLLWVLENLGEGKIVNQISVDEQTRHYAKAALDRMLSLHER